MKLVLLPGMDGTGELFKPFLDTLDTIEYQVIKLPTSGSQDYDSLASLIFTELPDQDFLLLAESFSGPLAARLATKEIIHLKGIVFVASFLSSPNRLALAAARFLPLKLFSKLPFSSLVLRNLMLGANASNSLIAQFRTTVTSVPSVTLKARLCSMQNLTVPSFSSGIPAFYIGGSEDSLVSPSKVREFKHYFPELIFRKVNGPHFLLQSNPSGCSHIIREILCLIEGSS